MLALSRNHIKQSASSTDSNVGRQNLHFDEKSVQRNESHTIRKGACGDRHEESAAFISVIQDNKENNSHRIHGSPNDKQQN